MAFHSKVKESMSGAMPGGLGESERQDLRLQDGTFCHFAFGTWTWVTWEIIIPVDPRR
jgi:hypothetical protein